MWWVKTAHTHTQTLILSLNSHPADIVMQAHLYGKTANSKSKSEYDFLVVFTACYVAVVTVCILVFFVPRISALAHELRQRRVLLLLLPPQLMGSLPYVRGIVEEVLAESSEDATGAGRSGRRGSGAGSVGAPK
jgi:hypothetical protein